jgi:hypothetical protein
LARIDGLRDELRQIGLYLDASEAETYQRTLRPLADWCNHHLNDEETD